MRGPMVGRLGRGEFVALAYRLGHEGVSGCLTLVERGGARHEAWLRRGYLTATRLAVEVAPLGELLREGGHVDDEAIARHLGGRRGAALGGRALVERGLVTAAAVDAALRRQAELRLERLAAIPSAELQLDESAGPAPVGGRPFALVPWTRGHVERRLTADRARELERRLGGARLSLRKDLVPDPLFLDDTDRRVVAALTRPRTLAEVATAARAPRLRLLGFVAFLEAVGALARLGAVATARTPVPAPDGPWRVLGLPPDASADDVRRAYLRLARELHPDRHPEAADDERRRLEARFAAVNDAYRELTPTR